MICDNRCFKIWSQHVVQNSLPCSINHRIMYWMHTKLKGISPLIHKYLLPSEYFLKSFFLVCTSYLLDFPTGCKNEVHSSDICTFFQYTRERVLQQRHLCLKKKSPQKVIFHFAFWYNPIIHLSCFFGERKDIERCFVHAQYW